MREKLIELYREAHKKAHEHCNNVRCDKCEYEHFGGNCIRIAKADHLIANGVTIPVRCKDCKHYTEGMAIGMCKRDPERPLIPIPYNHYCGFAERKEDGKE